VYYDPEELDPVAAELGEFSAFTIDYREIGFVKKATLALVARFRTYIDNDCGTSAAGGEFKRKLLARPEWDWRVDPDPAADSGEV